MIKKLPIDGIDKNDKIICNTKDDLVCKINEIIDYLQAKEEASKGECDPCCERCKYLGSNCGGHQEDNPESKGECKCKCHIDSLTILCNKCVDKHSKIDERPVSTSTKDNTLNPPEHEEENQPQPDSKVEMVRMDLVNKHYVSKEKIKIRYNRQRCAECKHVECKELDKFMNSLGLGD